MKTLEAKPLDQNAENWKRENRLFTSTVLEAGASGAKSKSVRTHSDVIEQFDSFSLLKVLFLVRNWHCWSRKAFPRQMTPKAEKKLLKRRFFDTADRHEKLYGCRIAAVRQSPRMPWNWWCSFAFFESFLWHFIKKQRAEVIFRLSRPVSCKNQENGSGKQWSLHASLKATSLSTPLLMKPLGETSLWFVLCSSSLSHDHPLNLPVSYKHISALLVWSSCIPMTNSLKVCAQHSPSSDHTFLITKIITSGEAGVWKRKWQTTCLR